jgi:hypothetical protein
MTLHDFDVCDSDRRNFCRVTDSRCTDLYMEELFEAGVGDEDPFDDYRNILYPALIENLTEEQKVEGKPSMTLVELKGTF